MALDREEAANLLNDLHSILVVVRGEWQKQSAWSDWDQSVYERLLSAQAALATPTPNPAPSAPSRYHFTNEEPVTVRGVEGEIHIGAGWLAITEAEYIALSGGRVSDAQVDRAEAVLERWGMSNGKRTAARLALQAARLTAIDAPASVPVAWMYTSKYDGRVEFFPNNALWKEHGYAERHPDAIPLFAAPHPHQVPEGWQPIETAPKETRVLVAWPQMPYDKIPWAIQVARKSEQGGAWRSTLDSSVLPEAPTHWSPLPASPSSQASTSADQGGE